MKNLMRLSFAMALAELHCGGSAGHPLATDAGTSNADGPNAGDDGDAGAGLPKGIDPLTAFDPSLPVGDLNPILTMIGNVANVALGESVHTSGGFEAMRARLVRFLVENGGFRVLAMETPR